MNSTTDTIKCDKPECSEEAKVWYSLTDDGPAVLVRVCHLHGKEIRESVQPWQMLGRGVMHHGVAEGAGR